MAVRSWVAGIGRFLRKIGKRLNKLNPAKTQITEITNKINIKPNEKLRSISSRIEQKTLNFKLSEKINQYHVKTQFVKICIESIGFIKLNKKS